MLSQTTKVTDEIGFHARTAAIFSKEAAKFESKIEIAFGEKKVNAKSMLSIMSLGVKSGGSVIVSADGPDEGDALAQLIKLVESNFQV